MQPLRKNTQKNTLPIHLQTPYISMAQKKGFLPFGRIFLLIKPKKISLIWGSWPTVGGRLVGPLVGQSPSVGKTFPRGGRRCWPVDRASDNRKICLLPKIQSVYLYFKPQNLNLSFVCYLSHGFMPHFCTLETSGIFKSNIQPLIHTWGSWVTEQTKTKGKAKLTIEMLSQTLARVASLAFESFWFHGW